MSDRDEVGNLIQSRFPELSAVQAAQVLEFYDALMAENEVQNLTRLISPLDFVEGHLQDAIELLKAGFLEGRALDLGSGCGVPGLLCGALESRAWVLVDSEKRKAAFLADTARKMSLSRVSTYAGRAEAFLKSGRVDCITARAVGSVEKIMTWIGTCSTWNTLILLKGRGWEEEWENFQKSRFKRHLSVKNTHEYSVGAEEKRRVIVLLKRVPRGTRD